MTCLLVLLGMLAVQEPDATPEKVPQYDVVVYGATPAGIAAATRAGELGQTVLLVERTGRVGGMMTSGLGYSDFHTLPSLGGFFRDFADRVLASYRTTYGEDSAQVRDCYDGTLFEPKVAGAAFAQVLADAPRVEVRRHHQLVQVALDDPAATPRRVMALTLLDRTTGERPKVAGLAFIDASYTGDLLEAVAAPTAVGREGIGDYGERHAGVTYTSDGRILPGSSGVGDGKIPSYAFRPVLTAVAANRVPVPAPPGYDAADYAAVLPELLAAIETGTIDGVFSDGPSGVLRLRPLPGGKAEVVDQPGGLVRLSLPGENHAYPDGAPLVRKAVYDRHFQWALGLIHFLQTDGRIPQQMRADALRWGLCRDEFVRNGHFPPELHVRQCRRLRGAYVFRESDTQAAPGGVRAPLHADAIAVGDFSIECAGCAAAGPLHPGIVEGAFLVRTQPFQVPYASLHCAEVVNLLAPVCLSATHVAFCAAGTEPTWCSLGEAAGVAAAQMVTSRVDAAGVDVAAVQDVLHQAGTPTVYFADVAPSDPDFALAQRSGTRGLYHGLVDPAEVVLAEPRENFGQYHYPPEHHDAALGSAVTADLAATWLDRLPPADRAEASRLIDALPAADRTRRRVLAILDGF